MDGGVRIGTNASRLLGYFTGHKNFANAMPTNIGDAVGKGIDMAEGKSFVNLANLPDLVRRLILILSDFLT